MSPILGAVTIEERELRFTPQDPLLAWRLFRVRPFHDGYALCPPMIHSPAPPPWEPGVTVARCLEHDHAAPAPQCRCGIYAAVEGTLDSLPGYLRDNPHDRDPWAYAEVACSGRVFVDFRGVRVERAEVVRIALAETCWSGEEALADAKRALSERYRVPVGGLADAPGWVVDNVRAGANSREDGRQGPPPDDASLDLDLLGLGP